MSREEGIDFHTFHDYCAAMKEIKFFYIPPLSYAGVEGGRRWEIIISAAKSITSYSSVEAGEMKLGLEY